MFFFKIGQSILHIFFQCTNSFSISFLSSSDRLCIYALRSCLHVLLFLTVFDLKQNVINGIDVKLLG